MSVGTQRLRDDADRLRAGAIAKREDPTLVDVALAADASRRELSAKVDLLRSERKTISAEVGALLAAGGTNDDAKVMAGMMRSSAFRILQTKTSPSAVQKRIARSARGPLLVTPRFPRVATPPRLRHPSMTSSPSASASSTLSAARRLPAPPSPPTAPMAQRSSAH